MTNIGSSNMIHRLRHQILEDQRLVNCRPHLNAVLNSVEKEMRASSNTECLDFSCSRNPVKSHVIPDSFLRRLAGSGSLVAPHLESGKIGSFDSMSQKTKPVFAGYCTEHEKSLFPWEARGDLSSPQSAESQLMRVADAMWFEYRLRAKILDLAARGISPSAIIDWSEKPSPEERRVLQTQHESWLASGVELSRAAEDMHALRAALRRSFGLPNGGESTAVVGRVTIPASAGHFVLLADGAWIPDWYPLDGASRRPAPFVISVLHDRQGTRLCFASLEAATAPVLWMENRFNENSSAAMEFIIHWMRHGNFYWYMNADKWAGVDQDLREKLTVDLERGPYVAAAIYGDTTIERHPILRFGNGWG